MHEPKINTQAEKINPSGEHYPEKPSENLTGDNPAERTSTTGDDLQHVSVPVSLVVTRVRRRLEKAAADLDVNVDVIAHPPKDVTPRRRAIRALEKDGHGRYPAERFADIVLFQIEEPDAEMIAAGAAELEHALPKEVTASYRKTLAAVIYRAMFARVRT